MTTLVHGTPGVIMGWRWNVPVMVFGIVLLVLAIGAVAQSVVLLRRPEIFLSRSPARRLDPTWDEDKVRRWSRGFGWMGIVIGIFVALGAIGKILKG